PVEANALIAVYGGGGREHPLRLGSLKSNIGHAVAAAGVGGVIKTVMAMRHGLLPRTLHVDAPTPHADWGSGAVELLTEAAPWPDTGRPRRAGVSSFGMSGTNAHVVVEQAPPQEEAPTAPATPPGPLAWPLSARDDEVLRAQARRLLDRVEADPGLDPRDVAHSLAATRTRFAHRGVAVGRDREELLAGVRALASGSAAPTLARGRAVPGRRVVFVFPGQGSQWRGMAAGLFGSEPAFAARMRECEEALAPYLDFSPTAVLGGGPGAPRLEQIHVVQPVLFSVMVSLAALWRAHGVRPSAVVGHSQGEIAAACVAGALSLDDAARVVVRRSALAAELLSGAGGMTSVALPRARVAELVGEAGGLLHEAAVNGPESVVVVGDPDALTRLEERCAAEGGYARRLSAAYASHSPEVRAMREPLLAGLAAITPRSGEVPFHSTVTASVLDGTALDAAYWYRNLREPVRYAEAVQALAGSGHTVFIEVSPHPVVAAGTRRTLEEAGAGDTVVLGSLRRDEDERLRFLTSVAEAHAHGVGPGAATPGGRPVDLPTYPFQRRRYWAPSTRPGPDVAAAGLGAADHPLLGATVSVADGGALLLTGRLSRAGHPWLADHSVLDTVLLPGTAFVEMALCAGAAAGCPGLAELTLRAPLAVGEAGAQVQVSVAAPDEHGRRALRVHARPADGGDDHPWTAHAEGALTPHPSAAPSSGGHWPPPGAVPVPVDGVYARLADLGYGYGPAFRGMRAAWRHGDDVFAEVGLARERHVEAGRYGVHPALLDAALHAATLLEGAGARLLLPFAWCGAALHATGATALRVRVRRTGPDAVSLTATDPAGAPVVSVESLTLRPVTGERLLAGTASGPRDLYTPRWTALDAPEPSERSWAVLGDALPGLVSSPGGGAVPAYADVAALDAAVAAGAPKPDAVLLPCPAGHGATGPAVRAATRGVLSVVQEWLASERSARLVVLTRGAVSALPGEDVPDLAHAPVWGLVRAAQAEAPDRLALVDSDAPVPAPGALSAASDGSEGQIAVRAGVPYVPRLVRAPVPERAETSLAGGTVLVTGATGTLGALVARHLVSRRGAERLLLVGRRGGAAPGAPELAAELTALGADVEFAACDAADRDALAGLVSAIPADRPLRAVVHAAGVLDDGVVSALTPERLDRVMRPKVDAALHLHELTRGLDLAAFVLFSSASGVLGSPGQANYAAANAFLDALAHRRHALGLAATSLSWGLWARRSGMSGHLTEADLVRMGRMGLGAPIEAGQGMALLDAALDSGLPHLVPLPLASSGRVARSAAVPPPLRALVRVAPVRASGEDGGSPDSAGLRARLAGLPPSEQGAVLLDLVRAATAEVLGHPAAAAVDPGQRFLEAGLDSLTAVELRNRLGTATGLRLGPGLVFDHPTPAAVARLLEAGLNRAGTPRPGPARGAVGADADDGGFDGIAALFRDSCRRGRVDDGFALVKAAGRLRASFASPAGFGERPAPVRLARGPARPALVCLPSLVMVSGVQEYARFGAALRGLRDVTVLPQPGFAPGEPLPGTVEAVVGFQVDAVRVAVGDEPFVLVGRSSGGWVAHAVTERLEGLGAPPAALVLLDTPMPGERLTLPVIGTGVVERDHEFGLMNGVRVSAMGGYVALFEDWAPGVVRAPTVLVRPDRPVRDRAGRVVGGGAWRFDWAPAHLDLEVPGDHLTMMEEHAASTAGAVHRWLSARRNAPGAAPVDPAGNHGGADRVRPRVTG
ncbi:type I polyketide synthase, partial [Actinorugispora endophytica]